MPKRALNSFSVLEQYFDSVNDKNFKKNTFVLSHQDSKVEILKKYAEAVGLVLEDNPQEYGYRETEHAQAMARAKSEPVGSDFDLIITVTMADVMILK